MDELAPLEAVRLVAQEYGIEGRLLKPCIAFLMDGNIGASGRHQAAFVIAIELRRLGWTESAALDALKTWGAKLGYSPQRATRTIASAFRKSGQGTYKYHPPGLRNKPGGVYASVLGDICRDIGCPANCPGLSSLHRGPQTETFKRFVDLGWPRVLRQRRWHASVEVYRALCVLEERRGIVAGSPLFASYDQLAEIAQVSKKTVGRALLLFDRLDLITFSPGSGSGPNARDRRASEISRTMPIPTAEGAFSRAITSGVVAPPHIGGVLAQPSALVAGVNSDCRLSETSGERATSQPSEKGVG